MAIVDQFLPRKAMYSAVCAVVRCLSVHLSVTFVYYVEASEYIYIHILILKLFSPSGRPTILVFLYQTLWRYSDGDSPN